MAFNCLTLAKITTTTITMALLLLHGNWMPADGLGEEEDSRTEGDGIEDAKDAVGAVVRRHVEDLDEELLCVKDMGLFLLIH
jgi:hypothetical protein